MGARVSLGLTGDAGSGKSTVLGLLAELGVATMDADEEVRALLAQDESVIEAVTARFGARVRGADGVDRLALADIVFGDPGALADLERIVHPVVIARWEAWLASVESAVAAVEAVKLVESGMHHTLDHVWLVTCDRDERRRRLVARGWSEEEADRRMAAAAPLAPKLAVASVVIDCSGSREATMRQVTMALRRVRQGMAAG